MRARGGNGRLLTITLCLAAALGGAWLCLLHAVLSQRGSAPRAAAPLQEAAPVPEAAPVTELANAEPVMLPEPEEPAAPAEPQRNSAAPHSPTTPPQPARPATQPAPKPRRATHQGTDRKEPDLSAYRVRAHSAEGESFLPRDTSLSAKDLNAQQQARTEKEFDGGKGIIGDIYRGGKRLVDSMDAATLDATRRVLGSVARPEKAKLRPSGDGVRLKIDIPPESVKIGR